MDILKFFERKKGKSKEVAKDRLKLVLIHDRSDISPKLLEDMRNDIIAVIKRYVEVEEAEIDIKMTNERGNEDSLSKALVASFPIIKIKETEKKN